MKICLKNIVTISLVTIFILGCKTSPEVPDAFLNVPENKIDLIFKPTGQNNERKIPIGTIFDENNIEFISLKPNEKNEGLLVMPVTFYSLDKNWLVYDPRNKKSSVLLFDQNGEFIRYIGTKGKGPGEYIASSLCKINQDQRRIELVDGATSKILFYDFEGHFIKSMPLPLLFSDFIRDPYKEGYYLYTLDNFNTGYMKDFALENDYVLTKTDSSFRSQYGIEEIISSSDVLPYRNNGNKLFHYRNEIGFINNYSNDLYVIKENALESLVSFNIDGIDFQPKEYIKNADGNRFVNTWRKGFGFVGDLSISENKILEYIMASSPDPDRRYDPVFLYYNMDNQDYTFYSRLEDSSDTFTIGEFYLDANNSSFDAYAMIQQKDREEMRNTSSPVRQKIEAMWKENKRNPIIALMKFR